MLLGAFASVALVACGGGGDGVGGTPAPTPPAADGLRSDRASYFIGERAQLTARYAQGTGRIEPGLGPVASGATIASLPLDGPTRFELVVEVPGQAPVRHPLTLPVAYRDRMQKPGTYLGSGHGAALLTDGSVLLMAGSRGGGAFSDQIDRFDPATGQVTRWGELSDGRLAPTVLPLRDGRLWVAGGLTGVFDARNIDLIDPVSRTVSAGGKLVVSRNYATSLVLGDGRVLTVGGVAPGEGQPFNISPTAEIWDPATRTSTRLDARMAMGRISHQMTALPDGKVLITGGYTGISDGSTGYVFAELFDPVTLAFTVLQSPVQGTVALHTAVQQPDGSVLILGGDDWDGVNSRALAKVWRFDPSTRLFEARPPLALPRALAVAVPLRDGRVLLLGGHHEQTRHTESVELYDPTTGGRAVAPMDAQRAAHTATRLSDGRVFIAGGEDYHGAMATSLLIYD